jgi:hypothetical protein
MVRGQHINSCHFQIVPSTSMITGILAPPSAKAVHDSLLEHFQSTGPSSQSATPRAGADEIKTIYRSDDTCKSHQLAPFRAFEWKPRAPIQGHAPVSLPAWRATAREAMQTFAGPCDSIEAIEAAFQRRLDALQATSLSCLNMDVVDKLKKADFEVLYTMTRCVCAQSVHAFWLVDIGNVGPS